MPGCAALGCSNSSVKGFLMKRFPRDPERRELWVTAVERPNLKFTNGACLCEIHFDDDAWEKVRVDGTRKLKVFAVPTLALQAEGKKKREYTVKSTAESIAECTVECTVEFMAETEQAVCPNQQQEEMYSMKDISHVKKGSTSSSSAVISSSKHDRCIKLLEKSEKMRREIEKKLKAARIENKRLRASVGNGREIKT